jgi:hypothetical protein
VHRDYTPGNILFDDAILRLYWAQQSLITVDAVKRILGSGAWAWPRAFGP